MQTEQKENNKATLEIGGEVLPKLTLSVPLPTPPSEGDSNYVYWTTGVGLAVTGIGSGALAFVGWPFAAVGVAGLGVASVAGWLFSRDNSPEVLPPPPEKPGIENKSISKEPKIEQELEEQITCGCA